MINQGRHKYPKKAIKYPKDTGSPKIMQCTTCGKMFAARNSNRPICCRG